MTNAGRAPPQNDHPLGPVVRSQLKHGRIFARIRDDTIGIVIAPIYCNVFHVLSAYSVLFMLNYVCIMSSSSRGVKSNRFFPKYDPRRVSCKLHTK